MGITDELREYAWQHMTNNNEIRAIADRIDSEHERGMEERADRYSELRAKMNNCYVELPKDADGEYIHIGDRMESCDGDVFIVSSVDYGLHSSHGRGKFWMLWNEDADFYERAYECRHHKQPTVEDVLREFYVYAERGAERHREAVDDAVLAEYAAKLRLRGDAE